jgi:hypothetical protein
MHVLLTNFSFIYSDILVKIHIFAHLIADLEKNVATYRNFHLHFMPILYWVSNNSLHLRKIDSISNTRYIISIGYYCQLILFPKYLVIL